jgi:hypothetical protein
MPRFMAQKDVGKIHNIFGRHNIIQQNVAGDPVPAVLPSQLSNVVCLVQKVLEKLSKVDLERVLDMGLSKMANSTFGVVKKRASIKILNTIAHELEKAQYQSSQLTSLSFLVGLADPSLGRFIRGGIGVEELLAQQFQKRESLFRKVVNKKMGGHDQVFTPLTVAQDWSLERSLDKLYTGYGDVGYLASERLVHEPILQELVENFLIFLLNNLHLEDIRSKNWENVRRKVKEAIQVVLIPNLSAYHYTEGRPGGGAGFSPELATLSQEDAGGVKDINKLIKNGLLYRIQESFNQKDF